MSGPLAGVRVLELARILAGPWAGQAQAARNVAARPAQDDRALSRRAESSDHRVVGPHVDRPVALDDRMIAPQLRQAHLGGNGEGNQQEGREE